MDLSEGRSGLFPLRLRDLERTRRSTPVVLTIDTEPDDAWIDHRCDSVANVQQLLRLQELLDEFGAPATLLVTHKVAADDDACRLLLQLRDKHGAEVGAHLHPWETPPFLPSGIDVAHASFPHEMPGDFFEEKLMRLTGLISKKFGAPRSYRAGRWGIVAAHLPILERHGYVVDTSVMPLTDWRGTMGIPSAAGGRGGVDFRTAPRSPYHPAYNDITKIGIARILEIPVTVAYSRPVPSAIRRTYPLLPDLARRVLSRTRMLRAVAATPAEELEERLLPMLRSACAEKPCVINWTIHSSELMLNGSPSTRTQADLDSVFGRIRSLLKLLAASGGIEFMTLSQAANSWEGCTPQVVRPVRESAPFGDPPQAIKSAHASNGGPQVENAPARMGYILAASHSGSTLLAMLLGGQNEICTAGELKITNLGNPDAYRCSCGEIIRECSFWRRVADNMQKRGFDFDVTRAGTDFRGVQGWYSRRLLAPLHSGAMLEGLRDTALMFSPEWRRDYPRIQNRNAALVRSVLAAANKSVVVDSSKVALRLKYLLRNPDLDVRVIHTVRDGRAVVLTYVDPYNFADASDPRRRGGGSGQKYGPQAMSIEEAAHLWRRSNEEAEAAIAQLPPDRVIRVRYEQLCADPLSKVKRVSAFLGVDPLAARLDFRASPQHVIGNGMRHDKTSEIRLDERWKSVLTEQQLALFDRVAGALNRHYGYQ